MKLRWQWQEEAARLGQQPEFVPLRRYTNRWRRLTSSRQEHIQRSGLHHRPRERMSANGRGFLQHADIQVGFELLQANRTRKSRRSSTYDADVIFHDVPFDSGGAHLGCIRMAPSRRMVSPFNMEISKIEATSCANSSGLPRRLGNGIWLARDACNSGVMPSTIGVWKM